MYVEEELLCPQVGVAVIKDDAVEPRRGDQSDSLSDRGGNAYRHGLLLAVHPLELDEALDAILLLGVVANAEVLNLKDNHPHSNLETA